MSLNFQSTMIREDDNQSRAEARAMRQAFAVLGAMVAEGWVNFDFSSAGWSDQFEEQIKTIARVVHDYE